MVELIAGLIDVFADVPLTGNPLAVVQDADGLTDDQMRRIAGEFNQAETTFLMRSTRADWKLRSFTASGAEVFGAGHNALGAWLWLAENGDLGSLTAARTFQQEIGRDVCRLSSSRSAVASTAACARCLCACRIRWTTSRLWLTPSASIPETFCPNRLHVRPIPEPRTLWCAS